MTETNRRQQAADRLRRAVAAEAYDELQAAIAEYRREVEAAIAARQPHEPPPVEVAREAVDLTEWALRVLRSARAQTAARLEQVSAALRYHPTASASPNWKLEG